MAKKKADKKEESDTTLVERPISNENQIVSFMHCAKCLAEKPSHLSPREWGANEVGFTAQGIQIWCKRHECNVLHVDFQGVKHPANLTRKE